MAKIYLSFASSDKELAIELTKHLKDLGHEILYDWEDLIPGIDWRKELNEALKSSDGVIAMITEYSLNSQYVMGEIGAARTYSGIDGKFFIPVIFGDIQLPLIVSDIHCLFVKDRSLFETALAIHQAVNSLEIIRESQEKKTAEKLERIENKTSKYVEEAMKALKKRERGNKNISYVCYVLGLLSLLSGVMFSILNLMEFISHEKIQVDVEWTIVVVLTIKTAVIIGLLIACSKYCFTLGKTYTNEALKSADRSHAISFGQFYLDAYGATAKWDELKEVFQYWNINNESSFSKLESSQYDPKFVELVVELSKLVSSKGEKK